MFLFGQVPELVSYGIMAMLGVLFLVSLSNKRTRLAAFCQLFSFWGPYIGSATPRLKSGASLLRYYDKVMLEEDIC